jgi:Ion channel
MGERFHRREELARADVRGRGAACDRPSARVRPSRGRHGGGSAVVTTGTVGCGDTVPHTGSGRILGSVVIVAGVTFITFLNTTVTSLFVSADQQGLTRKCKERHAASEELTRALLKRLLERLEAIEEKLGQKRG